MTGRSLDFEDDVFVIGAIGRVFDAELYVFEKLRVPESLEIAAKRFFVIRIAFAAEDARLEGVAANAAIADEDDAVDDGGRILVGNRRGLRRSVFERRLCRCGCGLLRLLRLLLRRLRGFLRFNLCGRCGIQCSG